MSFLAQLRQQSPETDDGLQLCYCLLFDTRAQKTRLGLNLMALHNGIPTTAAKPYVIQHQHLTTPPPYLKADDLVTLKQLVSHSADWLKQHEGLIPNDDDWPLVSTLLQTGRCFVPTRAGSWQRAIAGAARPVDLHWAINAQGEQSLHWQHRHGSDYALSKDPLLLILKTTDYSQVSEATHRFMAHMDLIMNLQLSSLASDAVAAFTNQHGAALRDAGLPLPKPLPVAALEATCQPMIRYHSGEEPDQDGTTHYMTLHFRYQSDRYCFVQQPDTGNGQVAYFDGTTLLQHHRDLTQEQLAREQLTTFLHTTFADKGPEPLSTGTGWRSQHTDFWQTLMTEHLLTLNAMGFDNYIANTFTQRYICAEHYSVDLEQGADNDDHWLLTLKAHANGAEINLIPLLTQLQTFNRLQAQKKQAQIALADGRILLLPLATVDGIRAELADLMANNPDAIRLPTSQLSRLHHLQAQLPETTDWPSDNNTLKTAMAIHEAPQLLKNHQTYVNATLRPYQWLGVCWLQHLKQHSANGLLADDMGLGKTLQTLANLSVEKHQGDLKAPALIIAPTSLLHNWAAEIRRFVPHLKHQVMHGSQRHGAWANLQENDILITSYQLIANDIEHWQQQTLSWLILDEAQVIKNVRTRSSQAIRQLNADHRLCLSGTPLENHLGELWSLMDFLNPGCLGSMTAFKRYYQKPIEQDAHAERLQHLLSRIAPFILRREKALVADELPAKTVIAQSISLDSDQRDFYQSLKTRSLVELQTQLTEQGNNSGRQQLFVLSALLKLRQACCDPRLLGESGISSAKHAHCIAMINELVAEQRTLLVFSQFTQMLDLLAASLDDQGLPYLMLTGQTRHRQAVVDAFQRGEAQVFLISLKAGGVGLNLTRADTVIHYDPWWNAAAEQQATDRAHRIGQDKPVFVYQLLAEDTIEEKIAALQQRKAALSQHINQQAQSTGEDFAVSIEDLLALLQQDSNNTC